MTRRRRLSVIAHCTAVAVYERGTFTWVRTERTVADEDRP